MVLYIVGIFGCLWLIAEALTKDKDYILFNLPIFSNPLIVAATVVVSYTTQKFSKFMGKIWPMTSSSYYYAYDYLEALC